MIELDRSGYRLTRGNKSSASTRITVSVPDDILVKLKRLAQADSLPISEHVRVSLALYAATAEPLAWADQKPTEQQVKRLLDYGYKRKDIPETKGECAKALYRMMGKTQYVNSSEKANRLRHLTKGSYYEDMPDSTIIDTDLENEALKRNGIITETD